jgi:hypothetical protein
VQDLQVVRQDNPAPPPDQAVTTARTSKVKNYLKSRPRGVDELLQKYGDKEIVQLRICRAPLQEITKLFIDIISLNKFKQMMEKMGYDKVFHLYMVMEFSDGTEVGIEKIETVKVRYKIPPIEQTTTECKTVSVKSIKLKTLIETAEKKNSNLYYYTAWKYNCQDFVNTLATIAGAPLSLSSFILQNVYDMVKDNEMLQKRIMLITDTAGLTRRVSEDASSIAATASGDYRRHIQTSSSPDSRGKREEAVHKPK